MAVSYKCDICGDFYTPYGSYSEPNKIKLSFKNYVLVDYDCCPACMETFKETMNVLGTGKENDD